MADIISEHVAAVAAEFPHRPAAWIGEQAICDEFVEIDLRGRAGYRASPAETGQFAIVWLVEKALGEQGWRILLDSALRLIGRSGLLCLRFVQNRYVSIMGVKSFLFRKYAINAALIQEREIEGEWFAVFEIERAPCALDYDPRWTFGVLTQGRKAEAVGRFCHTVRTFGGEGHQIVIVGPRDALLDRYDVEYAKNTYSKKYADICVKKNDIVKLSRHNNIMVVHDRYWLNDDFFRGFDEFGYDFDFITVNQFHQSGKSYPAYCAIESRYNLLWGKIYDCKNDEQSWTGPYLNGGLIIAKRDLLEKVPFNPLIFHLQAEDVELADRMVAAGVVPRINRGSSTTTDAADSLTEIFIGSDRSDYEELLFGQTMRGEAPGVLNDIDARYHTVIGQRACSLGRPSFRQSRPETGVLLYGPYVWLAPGTYEISTLLSYGRDSVARVSEETERPRLLLDMVHAEDARTLHAETIESSADGSALLIQRRIELADRVTDFQVRGQVRAGDCWSMTLPTITRLWDQDELVVPESRYFTIAGTPTAFAGRPAFRQPAGVSGILLYGPYLSLPPGDYEISAVVARLPGETVDTMPAGILIDVVADPDAAVLAEHVVSFAIRETVHEFRCVISTKDGLENVEVRAHVAEPVGWAMTFPSFRRLGEARPN